MLGTTTNQVKTSHNQTQRNNTSILGKVTVLSLAVAAAPPAIGGALGIPPRGVNLISFSPNLLSVLPSFNSCLAFSRRFTSRIPHPTTCAQRSHSRIANAGDDVIRYWVGHTISKQNLKRVSGCDGYLNGVR
jgi:hypothetical protein